MAESQTPRRPDYSVLNLPPPADDDADGDANAEGHEAAKSAAGKTSANSQTILAPSNRWPSGQTPAQTVSKQNELANDKIVFTAPDGQNVAFAAEIPGGINGVSDKISYLFITQDQYANKGWRAFVVCKDDPHEQREVSLRDVDFAPLTHHELRATLGQDHPLVVGRSTSIDNNTVKSIDSPDEISQLVKQRIDLTSSWSDSGTTKIYHSGDSWVVMKKDFESGRIERFTQSGTGCLGRLEIIQGDPVSADKLGASSYGGFDWLENGELQRNPQSSSNALVPLPDDMKSTVAESAQYLKASELPHFIDTRMAMAFENLTDPGGVNPGVREDSKKLASKPNADEHQKAALTRNASAPRTRGAAPAAHP